MPFPDGAGRQAAVARRGERSRRFLNFLSERWRLLALRLASAVLVAWAIPLRSDGVAAGSPLRFAFDALRGDFGVSPTSGIEVAARVRVHAAGSAALLVAALVVANAIRIAGGRHLAPRMQGNAGFAALMALPVVAAVEAWADAVPSGARLGASVLDRAAALVLPAFALGAVCAWIGWRRAGGDTVPARLARDWPVVILGVLAAEVVFGRPGLGTLARDAVATNDTLLLRGVVLVVGVTLAVRVAFGPVPPPARALTSLRVLPYAAVVSSVGVAAVLLADALGLPSPASPDPTDAALGPAPGRWFGTDADGHDVLARTLEAGRGTLAVAVGALAIAAISALVLGVVAGSVRGAPERWLRVALARPFAMPLLAGAWLAAGPRPAWAAAAALAASVVLVPARVVATATDAAWRTRSPGVLAAAGRSLLAVGVAALGAVVLIEVVYGMLGLGPDGSATLGKEIAAQLPSAAAAPFAVIGPAIFTAAIGWALAALGHGMTRASDDVLGHVI